MGLPSKFIRYVRFFLSGRKTCVEVNGTRTAPFTLNEGLPQGSSISPLLFLIFINDIDVDLNPDTVASLFADDTAAWMKDGKVRGSNRTLMQDEINKILRWADKWKMRINEGKTKTMVLASSRKDTAWDPEFTANGKKVDSVNEYKFLGVTTDNGLRFNSHVNNIVIKARKRVNIIRCLSSKEWGSMLETQRSLYITYIRMALEYASAGWTSWISQSSLRSLQTVQNAGLRSVGNLYKTCPQDFLHLETGVEPLKYRYQQNDDITWDRYARLPDEDQRKQLLLKNAPVRLKTRKGWRHLTSERMGNWDVTRDVTTPPLPPWKEAENLILDMVELEKPKQEYTEEELLRLSMNKINSITSNIVIYTDGSTDGSQENGGAGVYIEDEQGNTLLQTSFAAGKYCSSYSGECVAMLRTVEWLLEHPQTSTICTDSLSLHSALASNDWKDKDPWLKQIKMKMFELQYSTTVLWVPSHCGIPGNDKADELAKTGSELPQDDIPVTHQIMKAKIKSRGWPITHPRAAETFGNKRKPDWKVEKKWPKAVRSLFSRLRTGHAKELKSYRHFIGLEDDATCEDCLSEDETIEHVLCKCPAEELTRIRLKRGGNFTIDMMVTKPEMCRKLLERKFVKLKIPDEEDVDEEEIEEEVH